MGLAESWRAGQLDFVNPGDGRCEKGKASAFVFASLFERVVRACLPTVLFLIIS